MKKTLTVLLLLGFVALFTACDKDGDTHTHEWEWVETTPATPTADGLETETCKTCGAESGNTRIIPHPSIIEFTINFNLDLFGTDVPCKAFIQDKRTTCGSATLQDIGIITTIQQTIENAYSAADVMEQIAFTNIFNGVNGDVTIYVNNPATSYKINAPDKLTMYFHIVYLQSNSATIQQEITDAVSAMNTGGASLPYNAE